LPSSKCFVTKKSLCIPCLPTHSYMFAWEEILCLFILHNLHVAQLH
jgi:hypothetical protein